MLSVREVAEILSLGKRTVWRYASAGMIPRPVKIGRASRWKSDQIEEFLQRLTPKTR